MSARYVVQKLYQLFDLERYILAGNADPLVVADLFEHWKRIWEWQSDNFEKVKTADR